MPASPEESLMPWPFIKHLLRLIQDVLLELIPEGVTTIGLLVIVALGRFLLKWWIGENAKFFDHLKVSWVFDMGDLVVLVRFIWMSIRKFR
jgi:hypothetical protein